MVDKRSLRSSKKDTQDTPAEDEKPKPTRTRSGRTRKAASKTQEDPPATESIQSEDVVMETESVTVPEMTNEDVEMKNADEEVKEETKEELPKEELPKEDPTASPITGTRVFNCILTVVIKQNLQLLERAVNTLDPRFTYRVLKMSNLRKRLSAEVLVQAIREVYPPDHPSVASLLSLLSSVCSCCIILILGIFYGSRYTCRETKGNTQIDTRRRRLH
jgi:hypothetical protein